ncbi:MAG TPA: DNA gyrase subunit A, partial [Gammaproteobacteria bacterium]|nr:DNA gyrase subunit A [Gammaproteobacteria bacterium]
DFIDKLFIANTHDTILCFSSNGKAYWLKVYELPQAGRTSRGKPIVNLLPLAAGERITAVLPVKEFDEDHFVFMATTSGTVKKTPLSHFSRPRTNGIIAVELRDDDHLVDVAITDGSKDVMLFTNVGKAIRFPESAVRAMGRTACGVRGLRMSEGQKLIALNIVEDGYILSVTENGYGKRTPVDDYPAHGRGGQGVISIQTNDRNGDVVGAVQVDEQNEIMLITNAGTLIRTRVTEISSMGRNTQGVRLAAVSEGEKLVGLDRVISIEEDVIDDAAQADDAPAANDTDSTED